MSQPYPKTAAGVQIVDHVFESTEHDEATCRVCGYSKRVLWHVTAPATATPEAVKHPAHYGGDTVYEAIKVIEAWGLGFCLGNTVKYISRAGRKPGAEMLTDLRKAMWYLDREIRRREAEESRGQ